MSQLTRQRIRLAVDTSRFEQIKDVRTAAAPILWMGNDVAFELALFRGSDLLQVDNFASMTLEVKNNDAAGIAGSALMTQTVTAEEISNAVTTTSWEGETAQHAVFAFTGTETNLSLDGELEKTFYLVVSGLTSDSPARRVTFGTTLLKIRQSGIAGAGEPPAPLTHYYTAAESDSRFALRAPADANYRIKNGTELQLFDTTLNQWRSIWFADGTLQFGVPEA